MSTLIERARLTGEEIGECLGGSIRKFPNMVKRDWQTVADAATAKALWAVVEWLDDAMSGGFTPIGAILSIRGALEQAGTQPPVEVIYHDEYAYHESPYRQQEKP